jgi:hypothetical protein
MEYKEFRSSGVQEFRSSGVQEFSLSRMAKLQAHRALSRVCDQSTGIVAGS